jgi:hypothetical protein
MRSKPLILVALAGTQLAVRAGTKLIVTAGLVAMAGFYGWVAVTISATLSYGIIAAQMVVYGLGLGLTSAPATEALHQASTNGFLHGLTVGALVAGSVAAAGAPLAA